MERAISRQRSPLDYAEVELSTSYKQGSTSGPERTTIDTGSIDSRWGGAIAYGQNTLALG